MSASRQDLREELVSVIGAGSEIPTEDRVHLADVFLDRLETDFRLVPRSEALHQAHGEGFERRPMFRMWPTLPVLLGVLVILSILSGPMFVFHPPILLFAVVLFFIWRSRRWRHGAGFTR